jgi:hypothetical protein
MELEAAVVKLLTDHRMRPDAVAEVARVCRAAGYLTALPVLERLDIGGLHQEVVDKAIGHLGDAAERPVGIWFSDGRDAGEVREHPVNPAALLLVEASEAWMFSLGGGWTSFDPDTEKWRRMFYRRAGTQEAAAAIQGLGHTFHQASAEELAELVDILFPAQAADWPDRVSHSPGSKALAVHLGEGPVEARARALLLADAGDFPGAAAELDDALSQRKAPQDLRFLLGLARAAAGDVTGAAAAWEACQEKARRKKDWFVVAAAKRLNTV